jgi:hypothetical protein
MAWSAKLFSLLLFATMLVRAQDAPAPATPPDHPEIPEPAEPVWDLEPARNGWARHGRTTFGENVVVRTNESVSELVLIGGSADIQGNVEGDVVAIGASVTVSGRVDGNVVIVGGRGTFSGEVEDEVTVVLGSATITETAKLDSQVVLLGGPFKISPDATIHGERIVMPFGDFVPEIEWLKAWFVRGPLFGRLLTFNVAWPWFVAGTFLAVYLLTLLVFPAAARAVYNALEDRPVTSIVTGLLTLILFAPLTAILIISVAGILVLPFLKIALLLALLFGKVGVICFLGRGLGKTSGANFLQVPFLAFVIGAIILTFSYAIPLFGIFAWAMATVFGLGGAIVALSNTFKREESNVPPAPVLVSTLRTGEAPASAPAPAASQPIPGAAAPTASASAPPHLANIANLNPQDTVLLPRAGFWKRFLASMLDLLIVALAVAVIPVIGPALFIPCAVVYFVALWTWRGTTLGGIVFGHKMIRTDGRPVSFAVALVRSLLSLFSMVVFFLGFLWAAWDREKQTWHDKIAGTVVINMPQGLALI